VNKVIIGCIAEAQKHTAARVHAVAVLSNHFHLLASFDEVEKMAKFMCHLKANLSKKLAKIHGWSGPMYPGRYKHVPVTDEPEAQLARLHYLLSQGAKEGLVASPLDWPGVHSARALLEGRTLRGARVDRRALHARRRRGEEVSEVDVLEEIELELEPIPALASMGAEERRRAISEVVRLIEEETEAMHRHEGTSPAGAETVLGRSPRERTKPPKKRPLPWVHAHRRSEREKWIEARRLFEVAYRSAADRLRNGEREVEFPPNSFPPCLPFVPPRSGD
jgi:hypothetical protein